MVLGKNILFAFSIFFIGAEMEGPVKMGFHGRQGHIKSSLPGQNDRHFADDLSNAFSWMKILYFDSNYTEFVPVDSIDNKWALLQIMRTGGGGGGVEITLGGGGGGGGVEITYSIQRLQMTRPHKRPGPRLNIKTVFPRYGDSHVKDKTAVRTSYL